MPTYEYRTKDSKKSCSKCAKGFEFVQRMSDEALAACPGCGSPVERVFSVFSMTVSTSTKKLLSDKNLQKHGFSKLVKEDKGKYRKLY